MRNLKTYYRNLSNSLLLELNGFERTDYKRGRMFLSHGNDIFASAGKPSELIFLAFVHGSCIFIVSRFDRRASLRIFRTRCHFQEARRKVAIVSRDVISRMFVAFAILWYADYTKFLVAKKNLSY